MKLSDYVIDFLIQRGLRHIFLLPGGGCMHLADSVGRRPELDYICCLHEQGCAFAAEAYGEYGNTPACALVTSGPGGTNAVTGLAAAWIEGSPCLFLSGQAKRPDLIRHQPLPVRSMGQQEVDIVSVVQPLTKHAAIILDPTRIRAELEQAWWTMTAGRPGPVWLDLPLDVQAAEIDPATLPAWTPGGPTEPVPGPSLAAEILSTFREARRPVVFAGNGIRAAGMTDAFRALAQKLGAPVLLTWKAADYLGDDDPLYVGRPGGIGQRAANFTQQKCDWLLVLGARLDLPSVAYNQRNFAPGARKYIVDVDPAELAKLQVSGAQKIAADLGAFLPRLLEAADRTALTPPAAWLAQCRSWVERYPVMQRQYWETAPGAISTYVIMEVLSELLGPSDVIVPGSSGPCSDIFYQAFRVKRGQRILNAPGLGAMGTGLPGTIGAAVASGRRVVNINGEGGFQLNIQELETVRRLRLPAKFIVLDNGGYRSIVGLQRGHFQGRLVGSEASSRLTMPDTARVAAAYGLPTFSVDEVGRLRGVLAELLELPGPAVCVVQTSVDEVTAPRVTSQIQPDGTMLSRPMEDMWPFLDRAELAAVMAL